MLTVIKPFCNEFHRENRMDLILSEALATVETEYLLTAKELEACDLRGRKILFAVCLSEAGINMEYYRILEYFRRAPGCLTGCSGAVIVDGSGELFTKSLARRLVFSANAAGCAFISRPLVEATGSLYNFKVISKVLGTDLLGAYQMLTERLIKRLCDFEMLKIRHPNVLAIHASSRKTSNSLMLWEKVKSYLDESIKVTEISLRNGQLLDCRGCKYEECMHFGEKGGCFYGGVMVEQVYPAIIECDCLVMICPKYNDAVSANITAFINRLTAVFRTHDFSKKKIFALVVSGYSGGDIVAEQIISAMNFNKNFILPAKFALVETANDPGSILDVEALEEKAGIFARQIRA